MMIKVMLSQLFFPYLATVLEQHRSRISSHSPERTILSRWAADVVAIPPLLEEAPIAEAPEEEEAEEPPGLD